jgi:hypothetical protein
MYSTFASLVAIQRGAQPGRRPKNVTNFNQMYRSVSMKSTIFADAFRRPRRRPVRGNRHRTLPQALPLSARLRGRVTTAEDGYRSRSTHPTGIQC